MVLVILLRKHGAIGWSRTDTWCAFACVITVALWQTTNSAILGLVGAMVADIIAGIPQVLKNWKSPHEEVVLPWLMFSIGNALNLGSVPNWDSTLWVYPVYMAVMSFLIVLPVIVYRVKKMGAAK